MMNDNELANLLQHYGKVLVADDYMADCFDEDGFTSHSISSKVYAYNGKIFYVGTLDGKVVSCLRLSDIAETA